MPLFVPWSMRYTAAMRPAVASGKTCGLKDVKLAVSPPGRYFCCFAAGVVSWRLCGCTNAPLSCYVSPVARGLVGVAQGMVAATTLRTYVLKRVEGDSA